MENHALNKTASKVFLVLTKYIPIFTAFIIMIHAGIQVGGIEDKNT